MPDSTLSAALKEAYASCPTSTVIYDTLQISHDDIATDIFIVNRLEDLAATLEGDTVATTFSAVPFDFKLPKKDGQGVPELTVAIGNIKKEASNYVESVRDSHKPIVIRYRPYLSTDLTQPQMDPPLHLEVKEASITNFQVQFRAVFFNFKNQLWPLEMYTQKRFPTIGQG